MDFKGPGYNASVFVDVTSEFVEVETTNYGVIALLNDLHKGRNSGEVWKWFIDITALLMIFFVLTGVCLLLPKKRRLIPPSNGRCLGLQSHLLSILSPYLNHYLT